MKTALQLSAQRKLRAADVLFANGKWEKANMLYSGIAVPLSDVESAAYVAQQRARCFARLGQPDEAFKHYNKFMREYRHTSLAGDALIRAGVLCAGPLGKPRDATRFFEAVTRDYPEKPSAEVAHLYLATLAWWTKQWREAETLHKSFLEKYPDHPFRQDILDVRLPAIAKREII